GEGGRGDEGLSGRRFNAVNEDNAGDWKTSETGDREGTDASAGAWGGDAARHRDRAADGPGHCGDDPGAVGAALRRRCGGRVASAGAHLPAVSLCGPACPAARSDQPSPGPESGRAALYLHPDDRGRADQPCPWDRLSGPPYRLAPLL